MSKLLRFSMARAADPQGMRTVGIITKCDALEAGDEEGVCIFDLVNKKNNYVLTSYDRLFALLRIWLNGCTMAGSP